MVKVMDGNFANAKISYEFDDKLKAVLDSTPAEADRLLRVSEKKTLDLKIGSQMLRKHLRENQNKITRTEHRNLSNPDYLAFAIMYCSHYHKYKDLTELNEDLAHPGQRGFIKPLFKIDSGGDSEFTTTCACGKGIEDLYYYQNPDTQLGFLMGNVCINTGFILNDLEKKEIDEAFILNCESCGHKTYKTNSRGDPKKEKGCSRCARTKRRCETCNLYKVKKDDPDWKKDCINCYLESKGKRFRWRNHYNISKN